MKLTVFGATGGTGEELVRQALAGGHEVTAVVRHPEALAIRDPQLTAAPGDILSPAWPGTGLSKADAVLSALGARQRNNPARVYSRGTAAVIAAMDKEGVRRFVGISAGPVAPDSAKPFMDRHVIHPLLYRLFGGSYDDMRAMERLLAGSRLDWTIFRPPRLTSGPKTGRYRTAIDGPLPRARSVSRADLAGAMLAAVGDTATRRHAVAIAR